MQKCRCMAVSQQNFIISRQQSMSFVLLNWKLKNLNMMSCEELAVRWIEIQCNTQVQLNQLADTNFFFFLNFLYCTRLSQFSNDSSFTVFKRGPILLWEQANCSKRRYLFGCDLHSVFVWEENLVDCEFVIWWGLRDGVPKFGKFILLLFPGFSLIFLIMLMFKVNESLQKLDVFGVKILNMWHFTCLRFIEFKFQIYTGFYIIER